MAISEFNFTKTWVRSADFPATETNETQARADLQLLHDETKDYINNTLIPAVNRSLEKAEGSASFTLGRDSDGVYIDY